MSDVSQPSAPPPSAPAPASPAPPSAPQQADIPVHSPVDQPRPIGDQAPPKPEGQESNKQSHISRREALSNAFSRAKEAQEEVAKSQPKRERPGMGHNQPRRRSGTVKAASSLATPARRLLRSSHSRASSSPASSNQSGRSMNAPRTEIRRSDGARRPSRNGTPCRRACAVLFTRW